MIVTQSPFGDKVLYMKKNPSVDGHLEKYYIFIIESMKAGKL